MLPSIALFDICLRIATDPEPLLSLSARMRALCSLKAVNRELRDIVRDHALPALLLTGTGPRTGAMTAAGPAACLALEALASTSDRGIRNLETAFCTYPLFSGGPTDRATSVARLLELSAHDGALWRQVEIKREMRLRLRRTLCYRDARSAFRLRPSDLPLGAAGAPYSCEDLTDAALKRHGSHTAMLGRDAAVRSATRRRADNAAAKEARRRDLRAACLEAAGGDDADYRSVMLHDVATSSAFEAYVRHRARPNDGVLADVGVAAIAAFTAALAGLRGRRAEVEEDGMPWPRPCVEPSSAAAAKLTYIRDGSPAALAVVRHTSRQWELFCDAWRGAALVRHADEDSPWPDGYADACSIVWKSHRARTAATSMLCSAVGSSASALRRRWDAMAKLVGDDEALASRAASLSALVHAFDRDDGVADDATAGAAVLADARDRTFREFRGNAWRAVEAQLRFGDDTSRMVRAAVGNAILRQAFYEDGLHDASAIASAIAKRVQSALLAPSAAQLLLAAADARCRHPRSSGPCGRCNENLAAATCGRGMCGPCCRAEACSDMCPRHTAGRT